MYLVFRYCGLLCLNYVIVVSWKEKFIFMMLYELIDEVIII